MGIMKRLVTAALLLFVAVSLVYLVVGEVGKGPVTSPAGSVNSSVSAGRKVILYYFHGNMRCDTCRKIEAYSRAAVKSSFPEEIKKGELVWSIVNIDEEVNEHFVSDYDLQTRSLVLSLVTGGKQERWKNLDKIWDLVGDKRQFSTYVENETRAFLKGAN